MAQVVAYFTGFETGDASELVGIDAGGSIQTPTKRTGGYALKLASGSPTNLALLTATLSSTQVVVRAYVYFDGAPASATDAWFLIYNNPTALVKGYVDAAQMFHLVDNAGVDTAGTAVLSANTWYRIEIVWTATSTFQLYIDGVRDINTTDTGATFTATRVYLAGDQGCNVFYDDVRVDTGGNTLIGLGQCIARQGLAGAPTYNAWTKNGAATSALCWSDTPFSAATNCSDAVLNDAQTMLVTKFSLNPSRAVEGPQIINALDTINAVKVAMIANSAVAGNIDIRRRVGGVDTNATVALTTSDAYYETPLFTSTVANLDAYQIGVANDLVTTAETVEDMWMMVDYTPAVPTIVGAFVEHGATGLVVRRKPVMVAY